MRCVDENIQIPEQNVGLLGSNRIDANTPSWKVAEKSGFNLIEKKMYKDIDDEKEELYRFYVIRGQEDK